LSWVKKFILAFLLGVLTFTPWVILIGSLKVVEFFQPNFWEIPWWIPPAFGLVVAISFFLFAVADHLLKVQVDYNPIHLGLEYLILSGFYLSVIFFRQYPYLLLLGLLFIVLVRLIFFHEIFDWVYFIFGACLGPTMEIILTSFGLYHFSEPDFLGMPYWLPVFWGNVALAIRRVGWILAPTPSPSAGISEMEFHPR
jgi:hypothetical protein